MHAGLSGARVLALAFLAVAFCGGAQDLELSMSPERPRPGQDLLVTIVVPEVEARGLRVEAGSGAAGMAFVSAVVTPERGGERLAARVTLSYRVLSSGTLSTGPITLRSGKRAWPLKALRIVVPEAASPALPEPARWLAPERVRRWSSFRIEAVDAAGRPLSPSSLAVRGLVTLRDPDGGFLAIALVGGQTALPETAPGLSGIRFAPRPVLVLDEPEALRATQASGRLGLALVATAQAPDLDGAFSFELRLEGSGSLPLLRAPRFAVQGPRGRLPTARTVVSRVDDYELRGGEYRGRVVFRVEVLALDPGPHRVSVEPYAVQDPSTGLVGLLRASELRFEVGERDEGDVAAAAFEALRAASLAELGSSQAARLVQAAFVARREGDEAAFLHGLHAAERRPPLLAWRLGAPLRAALDAREAALRLPRRPSDALGGAIWAPLLLASIATLLASLGLALRLMGSRRAQAAFRSRGPAGPGYRALILAVLAFLICALALGYAALERRTVFGVADSGAARVVPDQRSGAAFVLDYPAAARVLSRSGPWSLLELEDGRTGWFPSDAVTLY